MKNLVVLHLESISRQRLAAFAPVLPDTTRLLREAVVFDNFFASATSTLMVVGYLFHGNDFEYDTSTEFEGMLPNRNNPNLFSILRERGYNSQLICLSGFHHVKPVELLSWAGGLPPVWGTNDFPALFARFDELTDTPPFAIYVWNLITHIEHSLVLASQSNGLTDQIRRACSIADHAVGQIRAILERKGLLENTTIVLYGDHGDDPWTHGFKAGMTHGTEPYTDIIWTPLAIRDPGLAPRTVDGLARTIDIAPTCLALLGVHAKLPFAHSGIDLFQGAGDFAYSQNFTANQSDDAAKGIAKAFSITDDTYTLVASSRGLEMYAHRLDPGNHCNLLRLFTLDASGHLHLLRQPDAVGHFKAGWQDNPSSAHGVASSFQRLRSALAARVDAKRAYVLSRGVDPVHALSRACFDSISQEGRDAFYRRPATPATVPARMPAFDISYKPR